MIDENYLQTVLSALYETAPDLEVERIDPDANLRDQFELDSMDMLNFIVALLDAAGVNIPESNYPELESLNGCVQFLKGQRQSQISAEIVMPD